MVTMEVAEDNVCSSLHCFQYFLSDFYPGFYLVGVGKQSMPLVSQGDARINENPLFPGSYQTTHPANSQGFRSDYLNAHGFYHCSGPRR